MTGEVLPEGGDPRLKHQFDPKSINLITTTLFINQQTTPAEATRAVGNFYKKVGAQVEVPDSCPVFVGRTASGFTSKLQIRAESLSLESLDISRAVGRESVDMTKFGRESLSKNLDTLFPDFRDFMSMLSRLMSESGCGSTHGETLCQDFSRNRGGYGATFAFATRAETAQFSRPRRRPAMSKSF